MTTEERIMELAIDAAPHVRWEAVEEDEHGVVLIDAADRYEIELDPRALDEVIETAIIAAVAERDSEPMTIQEERFDRSLDGRAD